MAQKCVHKGCGKAFTDPDEECIYHPGPPEFHEGRKGWKCCKTRVLTFDEFLEIPPCTTGKHSAVDNTPAPEPKPSAEETISAPKPLPVTNNGTEGGATRRPIAPSARASASSSPAPPPEDESDDPSLPIDPGSTCRRRGCNATYTPDADRSEEQCVHHPGQALFHEGSKGWTCCKRRVLEFEGFMKIEGCRTKQRHLFVGKGKKGEEHVESVRHDFYQTPTSVIASLYLKKIDKSNSTVTFSSVTTIDLDLKTSDNKRYKQQIPLYGPIDMGKSSFKILGTKMEFNLVKTDQTSWPVLRSDDKATGEIIQTGRAGKA